MYSLFLSGDRKSQIIILSVYASQCVYFECVSKISGKIHYQLLKDGGWEGERVREKEKERLLFLFL